MAPAPRLLCLALAAVTLAPLAGALVPPVPPHVAPLGVPQEGPDVPTINGPTAIVTAFEEEYWHNTEGARTHLIQVPASPTGAWDRIVLSFREHPNMAVPEEQDPWDRLCSAAIAGVEVLRCTTPRTDMTLRKDVTEFAALLPPGATVGVSANTGSYDQPEFYVGGQYVTMKLEFYADEPTGALVAAPANPIPAWYYRGMCTNGVPQTATVAFPTGAPAGAVAEITLSGHGGEEFWYETARQRVFHLYVDGTEVGQAYAMPYVYAFVGVYGGAAFHHKYLYWTAQQALDIAGVHTGVGEIPPYRVAILPDHLALLTGARTVQLVGEGGGCYWPASVTFLLS
ncbi:MAG TPA: peptide-N4-asparagine amidase [Candidatus Thermoplasmatota archaeon]|jgi:hypothetical protein|nr:peptide-N4-asparagine amidase [Candidatus Thermoplasmatota archaeon]